ncbi:MAG: peptidoglycan-binding domain-containing protein [Paracoccaceae bacterium]
MTDRDAREPVSEGGAAVVTGESPEAVAPPGGAAETTGGDRVPARGDAEDPSQEARSAEAVVDGWRVGLGGPSEAEAPVPPGKPVESVAATSTAPSATGAGPAATATPGPRKAAPRTKTAAADLAAAAAKPPLAKVAAAPGPAEREAALELDAGARRQVQARLRALGFPPGPIDGAIGPRTRSALETWQRARGHAATGRLHAAGLAALAAEAPEVGVPPPPRSAAPPPTTTAADREPPDDRTGCARDATGIIVTGRSFACDLVYLREDLVATLLDG